MTFHAQSGIAEGLRQLRAAGLVESGTASGCTSAEIARIETSLELRLPAAYREFLAHLGKSAGAFLQGSDFACSQLVRVNHEARDLLRESGHSLPRTCLVFLMHQGYQFLYFHSGESDDPDVHRFEEGGSPQPLRMSFTSWFLRAAEDEIRIASGLGQ